MVDFHVLSPDKKREYLSRMKQEGLFAVVSAEVVDGLMRTGDLRAQVRDHCKALVDGGVSTFEATCRSNNWEEVAQHIVRAAENIQGLIPAVGTNANILTVHRAAELGIPVMVAAQGFVKLAGSYSVVPEQASAASDYLEFVHDKLGDLADDLRLTQAERKRLEDFPLEMDPIAYGRARGLIMIPSFVTPTEHYDAIARGAWHMQKAFPFGTNTPGPKGEWAGQFKAVPSVYKPYVHVCATGGIGPENLAEVISTPYVEVAGASKLIGKIPEETRKNAELYRRIVDETRAAAGKK